MKDTLTNHFKLRINLGMKITKDQYNEEFTDYRNAWNTLFASFIVNIGFGLAIPLFTSLGDINKNMGHLGFIRMDIGLTVGILLSSFMIARMITSYLIPDVTDSAGRKKILIGGLIVYGAATFLIGFQQDFWPLLLLRALEGGSVGVSFPISEALMVDSVPQRKRGEWMGKFFITFNAGFAIGPAIGSFLYGFSINTLGMTKYSAFILPYALTGCMGFLSAFIVHRYVHDIFKPITKNVEDVERQKEYEMAKEYKVPFLRRLYSINIINGFAIGLIAPIFTFYALDEFHIAVDNVGYIFLIAGLGGLPINWISGKLADKYNRVAIAALGMAIGTIAFIGIGIYTTVLIVVVFFVFRFMAMMFFVPAFRAFQADVIPPIVRGRYFGRIQAIFNLGAASAPIIGGFMYDGLKGQTSTFFGWTMYSSGLIFLFCAFVSGLSTVLIYLIYRLYNPEVHSYKNTPLGSYSQSDYKDVAFTLD